MEKENNLPTLLICFVNGGGGKAKQCVFKPVSVDSSSRKLTIQLRARTLRLLQPLAECTQSRHGVCSKLGLLLYHFRGVCVLLHCAVVLYAKCEYLSL